MDGKSSEIPTIYTTEQAAKVLGCSAYTVRVMCRDKSLPDFCTCFRVGEGRGSWRLVIDLAAMKGGPHGT